MKANLALNEPKLLKFWQDEDIYAKIRQEYSGRPKYILHDGPPYANGNIHIGHALNKILKDMIVRFKTMQGFDAPYVPGWDCHGLPVEHQLFKELKITKEQISQVEFRKKAHAYAMRFVSLQKEEFIRLGISGDWNNPYLTLDKRYEYETIRALEELVKKGFICRGLKPVNWCPTCETALAEAEVEYEDKSSPSIYVKFKIVSQLAGEPVNQLDPHTRTPAHPHTDTYLVIWTTTPWTLYANVAVAAHFNVQYVVIETVKGNMVIAKNLLHNALKDMELSEKDIRCLKTIQGKELEGVLYQHPFLEDTITRKVILADYVSQDEGTGLVHIAPGHGMEDYAVGLQYGLDILMPVDKQGKFDRTVKDFSGWHVFTASKAIIEKLEALKCLLFFGQKQHSYPHCWRCKNPVLFRATKQWFLGLEHRELRKTIVEAIEKDIRFIPESGRERIKAMVQLRPDWCLSRQRYWGVPIPALHCTQCNEEILDAGVIANFARRVLSEGTQVWFKEDIAVFIPEDFACPHCKNTAFRRGEDILDVWFDSGVSHRAVLMADTQLAFPASLYLEGSDQHRGWFQASLITSMAIEGKVPFKAVLTHGFVVDGEGRKMSKSTGNVVSPEEVIREYGADILRLWAASSNYSEDVRISKDILSRLSDAYRKIRNTVRFLLGNLSDFSPEKDTVDYGRLIEVDRYILSCAYSLLEKVNKYYEAFEFYKIYQEIYQFCILQMSNFYLDIIKDRMYTFKKNGVERRSAQTVMQDILVILVKTIAPIVPFTAEEIWHYVAVKDKEKSVHCATWPEIKGKYIDDELQNKWYNLLQFRNKVLKAVEEKRANAEIGSSLEAALVIGITKENSYLKELLDRLPEVFIVSAVSLEEAKEPFIRVLKAKGAKCSRCWNYFQDTGENAQYPQICPKCVRALTS